jgi:uncharacterized membrane protein
MTTSAHLWAVGYDNADHARQAQQVVTSLAGPERSLQLLEIAMLDCLPDGSYLLNGKPLPVGKEIAHRGALGLLAGFALAVPLLTDEAVARFLDSTVPEVANTLGIDEKFKQDIASMIRPGTSALLVLDVAENMNAILPRLQGLGGRILKTNVDIERANLIQSTLARGLTS